MMQRAMMGVMAAGVMVGAFAGCETGQPGVKNEFGTLETRLAAEPPEIATAAVKALEDLELTIITNNSSALDGLVIARTARDEKVQVEIEDEGDVSEIEIRVGSFGDQATGMTILNKIRENLNLGE